ncbi:hypothetical protein BGY98DRAFT_969080 [Russula aff. rugulosa BPL654]|nr:hypothetical protein BGY98DRAFT_969080 [Russula aff. rugulosa BPL654]
MFLAKPSYLYLGAEFTLASSSPRSLEFYPPRVVSFLALAFSSVFIAATPGPPTQLNHFC